MRSRAWRRTATSRSRRRRPSRASRCRCRRAPAPNRPEDRAALPRPRLFAILNVTPDSFHDGGGIGDAAAARARALELVEEGADVIDIGAESTRPGARPVEEAEEIRRLAPVIEAVAAAVTAPISVDTMKPAVARAAFAAGAKIWNDVSALAYAPESLETAAELAAEVVLMHMRGTPQTMQRAPLYDDVIAEVSAFLAERAEAAIAAGVEPGRIWLDPGIGFGKTAAHNLALIARLDRIVGLGFPVLLGASRKGFIRAIDRRAESSEARLPGSIAVALAGAAAGAAGLRVHDIAATRQALAVAEAVERAR